MASLEFVLYRPEGTPHHRGALITVCTRGAKLYRPDGTPHRRCAPAHIDTHQELSTLIRFLFGHEKDESLKKLRENHENEIKVKQQQIQRGNQELESKLAELRVLQDEKRTRETVAKQEEEQRERLREEELARGKREQALAEAAKDTELLEKSMNSYYSCENRIGLEMPRTTSEIPKTTTREIPKTHNLFSNKIRI